MGPRRLGHGSWSSGIQYVAIDGSHSMPLTHVYKHMGGVVDATQSLMVPVQDLLLRKLQPCGDQYFLLKLSQCQNEPAYLVRL